jgi:CRP/FNR family cyclic AMP-dependent transcriptional regulator
VTVPHPAQTPFVRVDHGAIDELLTIERVAVLHRVELFHGVAGNELVPVARVLDEVRVDAGVTFIDRGAVEDWLFVIADGSVRVHIGDQLVRTIGTGGVVGDLAVLAPAPRSASVTAIEPTLLLRLRREPFDELLEEHPQIARAVIATLARMLQAEPVADDLVDPR